MHQPSRYKISRSQEEERPRAVDSSGEHDVIGAQRVKRAYKVTPGRQ
jgi:hypothetical protein